MSIEYCPECHQPMSNTAYGVRMPIFKWRLFQYIEKHPGQNSDVMGRHFGKTDECIRSHVAQINDLLMNTDVRIKGGKWIGYSVKKGKKP